MKEFIKRKWWYIILLLGTSAYVYCNRVYLFSTEIEVTSPASLLFILWIVLMLLPLFSEMELFGIKIKKEVEQVKSEVKEGFTELKMQMMDLKVSNSLLNNIQIDLQAPLPTEQQIDEAKQEVLDTNLTQGTSISSNIEYGVSEQSVKLFQVRLSIEKLVFDICDKTDFEGRKSFTSMLHYLNICEFINGKTVDLAKQIYNISSRGIHGEIISDKYMDFIDVTFPEVQSKLTEVQNRLTYQICPRCKQSSYSLYTNFCPKCGCTHNDE